MPFSMSLNDMLQTPSTCSRFQMKRRTLQLWIKPSSVV